MVALSFYLRYFVSFVMFILLELLVSLLPADRMINIFEDGVSKLDNSVAALEDNMDDVVEDNSTTVWCHSKCG